jgi:hypothetical protein
MKSYEICGQQKGDMNPTNWTKHINSCKFKIKTSKINLTNASIKHFFMKMQKLENIGAYMFYFILGRYIKPYRQLILM